MATVTLDRHEAETSDLPRVCLYCGRRANRAVRRKFTWCPFWTVSPIIRMLATKTMYVGVPVCLSHAGFQLFASWGPRAVEITPTKITIAKVAQEFADALYDYRRGREPEILDDDEREERRVRRVREDEERGPVSPAPSGGSGVLWVILGLAFGIPALLCGGFAVSLALLPPRTAPAYTFGPPPLIPAVPPREPRSEEIGLLAIAPDGGGLGSLPWPALLLNLRKEPLLLLDDAALDKILTELTAKESGTLNDALGQLTKAYPVERRRSEVAAAIEPLTTNWDPFVRQHATQALAVWGSRDNVPAFIKLLGDTFGPCRGEAMVALARFKDERGARKIAPRLKDIGDRHTASEALVAMGPVAEPAVAALLKDPDFRTRLEACHILQKIGTEASIPALTALQKDPDHQVKKAAQDALKAIAARPPAPDDD